MYMIKEYVSSEYNPATDLFPQLTTQHFTPAHLSFKQTHKFWVCSYVNIIIMQAA